MGGGGGEMKPITIYSLRVDDGTHSMDCPDGTDEHANKKKYNNYILRDWYSLRYIMQHAKPFLF